MIPLVDLLKDVNYRKIHGSENIYVKGITSDSRKVRKDFAYVVIHGHKHDGADFINDALTRGSNVIVSDKKELLPQESTMVETRDTRTALAIMVNNFYGHPSKKLNLIGVTGTNGKTTVSYLIESILQHKKITTGLIGTVEYRFSDYFYRANMTTPGIEFINYLLSKMINEEVNTAIMEVSSHALKQKRVAGLDFDIAVFTNLTPEHLDYHKNMKDYRNCKAELFTNLDSSKNNKKGGVLNIDDPASKQISAKMQTGYITYGIDTKADITATNISMNKNGSTFIVVYGKSKETFKTGLLGRHNVYNVLAAVGVGKLSGLQLSDMKDALSGFLGVPGRLQRIHTGKSFTVYVDYAHTEDALKEVLTTLKNTHDGKLTVVFGCGGDRDKKKRPGMGKIASQYSDFSIITSDNPRSENPDEIIRQIETGFNNKNYRIIPNREEAIRTAIKQCKNTDVLLIAGKGHEKYQIIGTNTYPFDDVKIAENTLAETDLTTV